MDIAYAMASGGGGTGVGSGGNLQFIIMMVLFFGIFYFLLILPQRKRDQEHKKMIESLKRGDKVITNGGIYGKVVDIKENKVVIEIAKGVEIDVLKSFIANRIKE
jgi:preprotein translocase subunit YajC